MLDNPIPLFLALAVISLTTSCSAAARPNPFASEDFKANPVAITDAEWPAGKCLSLDAGGCSIPISRSGFNKTGSISFWCKGADPTRLFKETLALKSVDSSISPYIFYNDLNNGYFLLYSLNYDGFYGDLMDWHNYIIAWDDEGAVFYYDGVPVLKRVESNSPQYYYIKLRIPDSLDRLSFEAAKGVSLAGVALYDAAISDEQARDIYSLVAERMKMQQVELVPSPRPLKTPEDKYAGISAEKWHGNRVGMDSTVPAPWTPVEVAKNVVRCWNREYAIAALGMDSIKSGGENLLRGSASLYAVDAAGKRLAVQRASKPGLVYHRPDSAEFVSTASLGNLAVRMVVNAEFDGFVKYRIEITPKKKTVVSELGIEVPVAKSIAKYINIHGSYSSYGNSTLRYPRVIPGKDIWWRFEPYTWVGNDDKGICLIVESERNCRWADRGAVLGLVDDKLSRKLVFRFINGKTLLDPHGGIVYEFALQATPMKPMLKDYRTYRMEGIAGDPGVGPGNVLIHEIPWFWCKPWPCFHDATADVSNAVATIKNALSKKLVKAGYVTPYSNFQKMGYRGYEVKDGEPMPYGRYRDLWSTHPMDDSCWPMAGANSCSMPTCPASASFCDFFIYDFCRFMDSHPDVNGFYLDETFAWACKNELHGCGFTSAKGTRLSEYPIFASRELRKRWHKVARALRPDFLLWSHDSAFVKPPQLAYSDIYSNGETIGYDSEDPLDAIDIRELRIEYSGRQFGVPQFFLPELTNDPKVPKATGSRRLATLLLLHDIQTWNRWASRAAVNEVWQVMNDFGLDDSAAFVPYWSAKPYARCACKQILVSAFVKSDAAMLVAYNTAKQPVKTVISIGAPLQVRGAHPKDTRFVERSPGKFDLSLDARECAIITLAARPK